MSWNNYFKLGIAGSELTFQAQVVDINVTEGNVELEQRNLSGALRWSFFRTNVPMITMNLAAVSDETLAMLRGFRQAMRSLNFIYNTALKIRNQMATSQTTTSIVIPPTSASGITILGVFLLTDIAKTGTNYFTSGSFDAATGTIALGSALPGANTDVWVDLSFTGYAVRLGGLIPVPHKGASKNLWQVQVDLRGV